MSNLFYVTQISQITLIIGHHRWLYISPAEITEIAEIFGPSQMAGVWGRLKARNSCVPMVASDQRSSDTKFDSKLFNGPAEIADIAERGPSQMAGVWGRLKARNYSKFDSKLFNGPAEFLCPAEIADIAERGPSQMAIYEGRLKARN